MNTLFREKRLHRIIEDLQGMILSNLSPLPLMRLEGKYGSPFQARQVAEMRST